MNRAPLPLLRFSPALIALAAAVPLAAQQSPGTFSLPEPTPTPTPPPAGPADEVAGVPIPPRSVAQPRIVPAPVLAPEPSSSAPSAPAPRATTSRQPAPVSSPSPARPLAVPAAPLASATPTPSPTQAPAPEVVPSPGVDTFTPPTVPPAEPAPSAPPSEPLGETVLDWRWLAAGALLLASLLGGGLLWRRRKPKVLRLAAPIAARENEVEPALPRIDISVEIPGSSRSVMTFTLRYRINLANRSDRAVNDLAVAVQVTTARQGQSNAAPLAAAQNVTRVERIGPHQSRSVTGEVQLPFAGIAPIMQGRTMLFIPLLHVTVEGEGQQALARSFVIGTPGATEGRVQPLRMDMLPGSGPDLRARAIAAPPPSCPPPSCPTSP